MNNTAIKKTVNLLGVEPLRSLLELIYGTMSREMINKAVRQGYAPPDWHEIITIATNHQVTDTELMDDIYNNKRNCKPSVVRQQAENFSYSCSKCKQRVRKSRQAS